MRIKKLHIIYILSTLLWMVNLVLRYQHNAELNEYVGNFFKDKLEMEYHAVAYNGWNFIETEMIIQKLSSKEKKIEKIEKIEKITKNIKQVNIKHNVLLNSLNITILQDKKNNEENNTFLYGPIKIEIQNYKKQIPEKVSLSMQTSIIDKGSGDKLLDLGVFSLLFESEKDSVCFSLNALNNPEILNEKALKKILEKSNSEIEKKRLSILLAMIKENKKYSFQMKGKKLNKEMLFFKNLGIDLQNSKISLNNGNISFKGYKLNSLNGIFNIIDYKNIGNDILTLYYLFDLQASLSNFNKGIEKKFKFKKDNLIGYTKFNRTITKFLEESFMDIGEAIFDKNKKNITIMVEDRKDKGVYINSKHYIEYLDQIIAIYTELMNLKDTGKKLSSEEK